MKRFIVLTLLVAGITASAHAERPVDAGREIALPAATLAAFESLAAATAAREKGVARDVVDRQLASSLNDLAASLPGITDARELAAYLELDMRLVGNEVQARLRDGSLTETSEVGAALTLLTGARADAVIRQVNSGAEGPDSPCFLDLGLCFTYCAAQPHWILRSLCAMDCELEFVGCVQGVVSPGNGIRRGGDAPNTVTDR